MRPGFNLILSSIALLDQELILQAGAQLHLPIVNVNLLVGEAKSEREEGTNDCRRARQNC